MKDISIHIVKLLQEIVKKFVEFQVISTCLLYTSLAADGIVGTATWAALYANQADTPETPEEPTEPENPTEPEAPSEDYTTFPEIYMYKRGVEEYVKKLQERLNLLGYD